MQHFEDLTAAHAAVVRAKEMVALLTPLVNDCDEFAAQTRELQFLRSCRNSLRPYFAAQKVNLLKTRILELTAELNKLAARLESRQEKKARELDEVVRFKHAVTQQGGDRLEQLDLELDRQRKALHTVQARARQYEANLNLLTLPMPQDDAAFEVLQGQLTAVLEQLETRTAGINDRKVELGVDFRTQRVEHVALQQEIASLSKRPSNIPDFQVQLRARLAQELNLSTEALPFAGELLQVKQDQAEWEGALERLLHSFALSLLVPDEHYRQAERWVNQTHLQGRLVYLHVRPRWGRDGNTQLTQHTAVHKLDIKANDTFSRYLNDKLRERFDVSCLADGEDFRRAARAVSLTGQIKSGDQHSKDDRRHINDRSNYVLGWSSASKIGVLQQKASVLESSMQADAAKLVKLDDELRSTQAQEKAASACRTLQLFDEVDWHAAALLVQRLEEEKLRLERASDTLVELRGLLLDAQTLVSASEAALAAFQKDIARIEARIETAQTTQAQAEALQAEVPPDELERLEQMHSPELRAQLTADQCDAQESTIRDTIQARIDAEDKQVARIRERIVLAMQKFRTAYPLDSTEMDATMEAQDEYRRTLTQLTFHDLPRFEARFQEELRKNAIHRIGLLNSEFDRQSREISERLDKINESLFDITYNPGRYIALTQTRSFNPEIQQFKDDLRACTDSEVHGSSDDHYAEAKFEQVKRILDRLRGRPAFSSDDRRWRSLVTDVRNWFSFAASERWFDTQKEYENYSDSSGKSGGQKEKLAYTILAASLAYQFGLDWGEQRSRKFRFVVIDEAFGRGSEDSADYGLRLFQKLNLQLMIVTPLQKINVIEPYIASVALVENRSSHGSQLMNMSIAEHRRRKLLQI